MVDGPLDPAKLEGEALTRWYRRTPQQIAEERHRAAAEAYNRFFYPTSPDPVLSADSTLDNQDPSRGNERHYADGPANASGPNASSVASADDILWIATGSGGYRPVRSANSNPGAWLQTPPSLPDGLPQNPAAPEDADLIDIGNPHNRRLKREWVKANNQPWPKTDDGRNYHVAHKRAIADGGTNTLDNIEPMHPDEHIAQHINNGDSARWGVRSAIARAFGGTVEPPTPGLVARGVGPLGILSAITGLLSGRIRTDTPIHTWYDMTGYPAPDDYQHMVDPTCRAMGINKPGMKCT